MAQSYLARLKDLFLALVLLLFEGLAFGAVPQKIASGQFLIFHDTLYLVEGTIGHEAGNQFVSLIPVTPDVDGKSLRTVQQSSMRVVGTFPSAEFDFSSAANNSPIDYDHVTRLNSPIEYLPPTTGPPNFPPGQGARFKTQTGDEMQIILRPAFKGPQGEMTVIEEKLGEGGINNVYNAHVFPPGEAPKPVALKLAKPELSNKALGAIERGYMNSRLLPPEVAIQTYNVGRVADVSGKPQLYVTMELAEPLDLATFIKQKFPNGLGHALLDPATEKQAWHILDEIQHQSKTILESLRSEHLVHGDIKPVNLLVDVLPDGSFHIRLNDMDSLVPMGEVQTFKTLPYLSPGDLVSTLRGGPIYTGPWTDDFAFKSSIYELVFGNYIYHEDVYQGGPDFVLRATEGVVKSEDDWVLLMKSAPHGYETRLGWVGNFSSSSPLAGQSGSASLNPVTADLVGSTGPDPHQVATTVPAPSKSVNCSIYSKVMLLKTLSKH